MTQSPTPAELGFRMPAEWEPQEAVWLSWPHKEESWPGAFEPVPAIFGEIARQIADDELVRINVADVGMEEEARGVLQRAGARMSQVRFHHNPTNDAWVRDHGPIYVVREARGRRERALTDWIYNSWGNKYPPCDLDNAIPARIAAESGEPIFSTGIVLEGGSIDVNGEGVLLTTESCLLNPNRNPSLSRSEIEQFLKDFLGVGKILWLGDGIEGDDTDGHIDDLARFVSPRTLVTVVEEDPLDANYGPLRDNLLRLQSLTDLDDRPFEVVTLPMPSPVWYEEQRLPASYANFLITNRKVLVPVFDDAHDRLALETLQRLFPDRVVVGINCRALIWGLGAIHCVTQQQPALEIV